MTGNCFYYEKLCSELFTVTFYLEMFSENNSMNLLIENSHFCIHIHES